MRPLSQRRIFVADRGDQGAGLFSFDHSATHLLQRCLASQDHATSTRRDRVSGVDGFGQRRGRDERDELRGQDRRDREHGLTMFIAMLKLDRKHAYTSTV